jgi:hypothetical protein
MANNNLNGSENILVKVDENNLIYIDPNSIVNGNTVESRGLIPENFVMYVNLEADLVPRSILTASAGQNIVGSLSSIAKGTLNFLKNQNGQDFDTSWTDAFLNSEEIKDIKTGDFTGEFKQNDSSGQSFGIDSINISIKGATFIPQITINFVDVRGKTLFESPKDSPYKAFFHLPWPIYYLTVKGYYGKAIRYRLHMTNFTSKYNETNGNFDITCTFVGSTYAYLNDIPLAGILNAPYMYYIESDSELKFNNRTGVNEKRIKKSSKGYSILKTVYDEYKAKGLLSKDFPVKTLREVITIAKSLDKILERTIFDQVVDFKLFNGVKEFEKKIIDFENSITAWSNINLTDEVVNFTDTDTVYFKLKGQATDKNTLEKITGTTTNTLEYLITNYQRELKEIQIFTDDLIKKDKNGIKSINVDFKKETFNLITNIKKINQYYKPFGTQYVIAKNLILSDIYEIQSSFVKERDKLQKSVEEKMNTIIKDPNNGIGVGFDPTIRNIFAVILANADVYIRLMKDVHKSAFDVSAQRKNVLSGLVDEAPGGDNIYPWPEIKKQTGTDKRKVLAYPGDPELQKKLKSDNKTLWPEIDFIENYVGVSTKRLDTLAEKEGGVGNVNFVFESNVDEKNYTPTSNLLNLSFRLPYSDKSISNIFYEIYERAKNATLFDTFNNPKTLQDLANIEFENIRFSFDEDYDLINLIKGVSTIDVLKNYLLSFSPLERFPYYLDNLDTVQYIKDIIETPFEIKQSYGNEFKTDKSSSFGRLKALLADYKVEDYRKNIYPFNSSQYLSYINKISFDDDLTFTNIFQIDTKSGFICTPFEPQSWVKSDYTTNLFSQKLEIGSSKINILNTPYFHKQLNSDFTGGTSNLILTGSTINAKYSGSAYLLLNSLPFKDLEDKLIFSGNSVNMASMFKEVGGTHYVPYHLMLKWGSIYHRYKKKIIDGVDILSGFLTTDVHPTTTPINGKQFFDSYIGTTGITFNVNGTNVNYSGNTNIGIHPYYENVFHNIINNYSFYDSSSPDSSLYLASTGGTYNTRSRKELDGINYWTSYVDNSKIFSGSTFYTLLPSDGANKKDYLNSYDNFNQGEQSNFRIIWYEDETTNGQSFSGITGNTYDEYTSSFNQDNRTLDKQFSFNVTHRKVVDLIATFSPDILDLFETYFIEFASERVNVEIERKIFPDYIETATGHRHYIRYDNFQNLLKSIVTVDSTKIDTTKDVYSSIRTIQEDNLKSITNDILTNDNLIKITLGNPKEINLHVWDGFTKFSTGNTFTYNEYNTTQNTPENNDFIKLYVGEDLDLKYRQFFITNNVELNEDNIKLFRPLILIFAGGYQDKFTTKNGFQTYIKENVLTKFENRFEIYLQQIIDKIKSPDFASKGTSNNKLTITNGYNDLLGKLELYNHFKSFNDKWSSGNSIGQRGLLEEFLFIDKANKDIGNQAYIALDKLIALEDPKNDNVDLYSVIGMLISGTGFDMRALPAYVNFNGTNFTNKSKVTSSKQVAKNIFGTFLEVDYQESAPKIVLQYTGPTSKHLELSDISEKYKFKNDSGNLFNGQGGPLSITIPEVFNTGDLSRSNKVVAFEVSIGDQNQGIFKGVKLDQNSIRNSSESFAVYENLGRSESGAGSYNVDIGLFDVYRQASYTCEVSCMGNVMIQPTMFFYLKNVPMFRGSYWITEVSHNIQGNKISTSFKGTRIPYASLPDPKDSFFSSYRVYFDKITNSAVAKVKQADSLIGSNKNEKSIQTDKGSVTVDNGGKTIPGETLIFESGISSFGIPYNGFEDEKYIQRVNNNGKWLRSIVVEMGSEKNNPLDDKKEMSLLNGVDRHGNNQLNTLKITPSPLLWESVRTVSSSKLFYSTKFLSNKITPNRIISTSTVFKNPENGKTVTVPPIGQSPMGIDNLTGPISVGPSVPGYGVALSKKLMITLGLKDGDVVYFRDDDPVIYK